MNNLILTIIDSPLNFAMFAAFSFLITFNIGIIIAIYYLAKSYYAEGKKPDVFNTIIKRDKDNER